MSGDVHVRFCERLGGRFPGATRPVVHCHTHEEATALLEAIGVRLSDCKLTLHPDKSKLVYCKDSKRRGDHEHVQFTFLGFTFRPRCAKGRGGALFTAFLPAVSTEAMKQMRKEIRGWKLHRRTGTELDVLARFVNPVLRGWWSYYSAFYSSAMRDVFYYFDRKLMLWARREYRRLRGRLIASFDWLQRVASESPRLFFGWQHFGLGSVR